MYIEEGRDVAEVEEANVPQVDRLLVQHRGRDHTASDRVPCRPKCFPVLGRRNTERRGSFRRGLQEWEDEGRAFKQP